jgi:hypothetical protein
VRRWRRFADIARDLERLRGRLVSGRPWRRKFLCVAIKA